MNDIKQKIKTELNAIESKHKVEILYACESGSRAWGFPSVNSDYDVRFLYLHPREWYLSVDVERRRDVIEQPINDSLDISGWDLRKALQLFHKSNPPLLEWLGSPIIYEEKYTAVQRMRDLAATYYNPIAASYHYLHMAQGNDRDYLQGERVRVKKYFYVLRPILAVNWLERDLGVVPTEFSVLVDRLIDDPALKQAIAMLITDKKAGRELDDGPRIPEISDFVDRELARLKEKQFQKALEKRPIAPLNDLFRSALNEVWGA